MKKDLNFYWRMGDYALEACPARLVRFDEDEPNVTINLVKFYPYKGKEAMYSIGYFYYDEHEPSWELKFVGDRFKDILEGDWVPISKDLPEELIPLNVTWINRDPAPYYKEIKDKRFVDTAVYYQGDWYWWTSVCVDYLKEYGDRAPVERIDRAIKIIAWKHLPEPWEGEQNE